MRLVLPLDGYVFWVRADLVSKSALANALGTPLNNATPNQVQYITGFAPTVDIQGSLHYATETRQEEAENYQVNRVVFTAEDPIDDLNVVNPNLLYIGAFDGLKFAISARGSYYEQSDTHHYSGFAVYPDMESQLINSVLGFDTQNAVVSNSLPIWLSMNSYGTVPYEPFGSPPFTLYPSFLVPQNISPPWASVHVYPEDTEAIAQSPNFGPTMSHYQLVKDRVKVTIWGSRNYSALDFVDFVSQYSLSQYHLFGIMNLPVVRDEKRTQSELNTIAMKKSVEFVINYNQSRTNDLSRQLILSAIPTFIFHT